MHFKPRNDFATDERPPGYRVIDLHSDGSIASEVVWLEGYVDGDVSPGLRTRPGKRRKPVHGGSGAASMPRTVSGACTETGAAVAVGFSAASTSRAHTTTPPRAGTAPAKQRRTRLPRQSNRVARVAAFQRKCRERRKAAQHPDDHEHAQVVSQVEGIRRREQRTQRTDGQAAEHVDEERAPREAVTRDAPNECRTKSRPAPPRPLPTATSRYQCHVGSVSRISLRVVRHAAARPSYPCFRQQSKARSRAARARC